MTSCITKALPLQPCGSLQSHSEAVGQKSTSKLMRWSGASEIIDSMHTSLTLFRRPRIRVPLLNLRSAITILSLPRYCPLCEEQRIGGVNFDTGDNYD